jgi:hypothetical protein
MFVLRSRLEAELRHDLAGSLREPFGNHRAVTPLPTAWSLETEQDRDPAHCHIGQLAGDGPRIKFPKDLGVVTALVFLNADSVEPRSWCEFAVDPVAGGWTARCAARNTDAEVVIGESTRPWPGFDVRYAHHSNIAHLTRRENKRR